MWKNTQTQNVEKYTKTKKWKNTLIRNVEPFNYTKYGLINKRLQPLHEGRLRCASYFWAVFQNQNDISDICSRLLPPFSPHLLLWGVIRIRIRVLQWLESSFLLMSARFLVLILLGQKQVLKYRKQTELFISTSSTTRTTWPVLITSKTLEMKTSIHIIITKTTITLGTKSLTCTNRSLPRSRLLLEHNSPEKPWDRFPNSVSSQEIIFSSKSFHRAHHAAPLRPGKTTTSDL